MHEIQIEKELCIVPLKTLTVLFSLDWWSDAVALYMFYYKQCKIQSTNQSLSTKEFCMKWLHRWEDRFLKSKKILSKYWLIEEIKQKDSKWRVVWWYIRLNYYNKYNKISDYFKSTTLNSTPPWNPALVFEGTNAYVNKEKCLCKWYKHNYKTNNYELFENNINLLDKLSIELNKPIKSIKYLCNKIKVISSALDIIPIYNKTTLLWTHIMLTNHQNNVHEIIDIIKLKWYNDSVSNYEELIDSDSFYLPNEI